ncbi:MAG: mechanosensitive ion channel family protein, partial [Prochlorococcaceae cyanobacterium]
PGHPLAPPRWSRSHRPWRSLLLGLLLVLLCSGPASAFPPAPLVPPPPPAPPPPGPLPAPPPVPGPPQGTTAAGPAPAWISLDGRRVVEIRVAAGAQTPQLAAARGSAELRRLADNHAIDPDQLEVRDEPPYAMVGLEQAGGFRPLLAVDDRAGGAFGQGRQELALRYRDQLRGAIRLYRSSHRLESWLTGTGLALLVLLVYALWWHLQQRLNRRLARTIEAAGQRWWPRGLRLGGGQLLDGEQLRDGLQALRRLGHWSLLLLASYLLIPLLLGFFPPTQAVAEGLRSQLLALAGRLLEQLINAIPSLLAVALILALTALVIRLSNAWFLALARGRLQLPGFYPEWGRPTGRIVAMLLLLAGLVIAWPFIPGSGSQVFQGAGLFLGVLAALGSSAAASNVISGLMLIYTRAFREGDRVEINGLVGVVVDQSLLVTRIQTPLDELVSIPNATVITASVRNYSLPGREIARPVALATCVTIGYDVPWRQVHGLLLEAVAQTPGLAATPAAKVLQTSLNDYHITYELNAAVADPLTYRETLSALLGAIQDSFARAGVEIMSPLFQVNRDGPANTVPPPGA